MRIKLAPQTKPNLKHPHASTSNIGRKSPTSLKPRKSKPLLGKILTLGTMGYWDLEDTQIKSFPQAHNPTNHKQPKQDTTKPIPNNESHSQIESTPKKGRNTDQPCTLEESTPNQINLTSIPILNSSQYRTSTQLK